jgi:hypothetical protein
MRLLIQLLWASLLITPLATLAGSDKAITVYAPDSVLPLQILYTANYGNMSIHEQYCQNTTCRFKVIGAHYFHNSHMPDVVTVTLGKDWGHACQIGFNDNGGWLHNKVRLVGTSCSGGWTIKSLPNDSFIISEQ